MRQSLPVSRQPLFWAALAFASGILLGTYAWRPWLWWTVAVTAFLAACLFFLHRRLHFARLLGLIGVVWLGAFCVQLDQAARRPSSLARFCDHRPVVTAYVKHDGVLRNGPFGKPQQSVDLETESFTDEAGRVTQAAGGVRLSVNYTAENQDYAGTQPTTLLYGQRLSFPAQLRLPRNYGNPGAMDTRAYLRKQGIFALATVKSSEIELLEGRGGSRAGGWLAAARRSVLSQIYTHWGKRDGPVLAAMIIGEKSLIDRETRRNFQSTGTYHILVVSGMNVGLMAFPVFWVLRRLHASMAVTTIVTMMVTGAYALLTDLGSPVLRALMMLWIYLLARLFYRDSRAALNSIGISAVILLVADTQTLFDPGFQMTFLCVLSIAGIGAPLLERTAEPYRHALMFLGSTDFDFHLAPRLAQFRLDLRMIAGRLARFIPGSPAERMALWMVGATVGLVLGAFELLLISALMQVVMVVPMAVYAHRAAFLTVPANCIVVPLTAVITPLAMVAVLLSYVSAAVAWLPCWFTTVLLHGITGSVHVLGDVRASELRIPAPGISSLLAAAVAFAVAMFAIRRRRAFAVLGLAAMIAASAWIALVPCRPQLRSNVLEVTAVDVGQGDSLLVVSPQGRTLLMDGGGLTGQPRSNFDLGEDVVSPYLWSRGISRLDAVAVSHAHADHIGGMSAVMANFRPRELWIAVVPPNGEMNGLLEQARAQGMEVRQFRAGSKFDFGGALAEVLAPPLDWEPRKQVRNNDSLVVKLTYLATSALLEGDAEKRIEHLLVANGNIRADLLKVGHHGSATSTLPEFLAAVRPRYAVICVGAQNHFGYPRPQTLARLRESKIATYRTDSLGGVTFYLDGHSVEPTLPNRR